MSTEEKNQAIMSILFTGIFFASTTVTSVLKLLGGFFEVDNLIDVYYEWDSIYSIVGGVRIEDTYSNIVATAINGSDWQLAMIMGYIYLIGTTLASLLALMGGLSKLVDPTNKVKGRIGLAGVIGFLAIAGEYFVLVLTLSSQNISYSIGIARTLVIVIGIVCILFADRVIKEEK